MYISYRNSTKFNANYINSGRISKLAQYSDKYESCPVNFVLLENNKNDNKLLKTLQQQWNGVYFIKCINTDAAWRDINRFKNIKIYALTDQNNNFDKLKAKSILGIAEIREKKENKKGILWYLQVKPDSINVSPDFAPKNKGCGSAMLKSLKQLYDSIELSSTDSESVRKFYKDNGFRNPIFANRFIWKIGILERLKRFLFN